MPSIDVLRRYAVVDPSDDSGVIDLCMAAAEVYIQGAAGSACDTGSPLYDLAVYDLATYYYDHRGDGSMADVEAPPSVRSIIRHLGLGG